MTVQELMDHLATLPPTAEVSIRTCEQQVGLPVYHKGFDIAYVAEGKVYFDVSYKQGGPL